MRVLRLLSVSIALVGVFLLAPHPSLAAAIEGAEVFVTTKSLDARDTNGVADVYVRDLQTGKVELVSVAANGQPGAGPSEEPVISANGRFVAFVTANPLVEEDDNGVRDVYLYDRQQHSTTLVSRAMDGKSGNGPSWQPSIDAQGLHVAFASRASNLVPHDTNGVVDVFVWTRPTGHVVRVSVGLAGQELDAPSYLPSLSPSGTIVGFATKGDLQTGKPARATQYYLVALDARPDRRPVWLAQGDKLVALRAPEGAPSMPAGPPPGQAPPAVPSDR